MFLGRMAHADSIGKHNASRYILFSLALFTFAGALAATLVADSPVATSPNHSASSSTTKTNSSTHMTQTPRSDSLVVNGRHINIPSNGSVNETVDGSKVQVNSSTNANSSSINVDVSSGGGG